MFLGVEENVGGGSPDFGVAVTEDIFNGIDVFGGVGVEDVGAEGFELGTGKNGSIRRTKKHESDQSSDHTFSTFG